ncbi:MAG: SsrA-binding protein SmpB [Candidatus Omnitrophica bacterium]|nr:SsrA-binding protein SmpB [Candidatus Omnitrophota bacterium]MDE2010390.1 SsrA-binding protein SmpB [Candidatus Omnitrophota bacterium]MDE2214776.1 SsrA-binding protein SmpB [Candidatus Omnitrophota bacterium]MDE2231441.1 SsrA-binding protein SmpB [Candidatus Omnitrophota bacterium]
MSVIATNKKAFHNYHLLDKWECGIALNGGEVKSLRSGGASFTDAFAHIDKGELYLHNLHINPYEQASYLNEAPDRPRKLLVHAKELERINGRLAGHSLTLVPTKIYFNKKGWAKVEIALAQGKKLYDKREDIKKREIKREIDRSVKRR